MNPKNQNEICECGHEKSEHQPNGKCRAYIDFRDYKFKLCPCTHFVPKTENHKPEERIYCKYCGARLKKDKFGLICPQDWTHKNDEEDSSPSGENQSQQITSHKNGTENAGEGQVFQNLSADALRGRRK